MRILPRAQREAMYAIYAFCRAVDDVADDGGPRDARLAELDALARRYRRALRRQASSRRAQASPDRSRRFGLQREDFLAVIDGMAMDADADIRAPDWATLDLYCDRVASAVGRLSVRIFGIDAEDAATALAHHLGRALQLTNILRDLDEDAARGPALPAARGAAARRHRRDRRPQTVLAHPRIGEACARGRARAARPFRARPDRIMAALPARARARAAPDGGRLPAHPRRPATARGWAAPRAPGASPTSCASSAAVLRYGIV